MNQKQLRVDFRKKCKEEKRRSYQYTMIGMIVTFVGLFLALVILLLDQFTTVFLYPWPIILYAIFTIVAVVGMVLEGMGEFKFSKEFKTHVASLKQEKVKVVVKEEEKKPTAVKVPSKPLKTLVKTTPKAPSKEKTTKPNKASTKQVSKEEKKSTTSPKKSQTSKSKTSVKTSSTKKSTKTTKAK